MTIRVCQYPSPRHHVVHVVRELQALGAPLPRINNHGLARRAHQRSARHEDRSKDRP